MLSSVPRGRNAAAAAVAYQPSWHGAPYILLEGSPLHGALGNLHQGSPLHPLDHIHPGAPLASGNRPRQGAPLYALSTKLYMGKPLHAAGTTLPSPSNPLHVEHNAQSKPLSAYTQPLLIGALIMFGSIHAHLAASDSQCAHPHAARAFPCSTYMTCLPAAMPISSMALPSLTYQHMLQVFLAHPWHALENAGHQATISCPPTAHIQPITAAENLIIDTFLAAIDAADNAPHRAFSTSPAILSRELPLSSHHTQCCSNSNPEQAFYGAHSPAHSRSGEIKDYQGGDNPPQHSRPLVPAASVIHAGQASIAAADDDHDACDSHEHGGQATLQQQV